MYPIYILRNRTGHTSSASGLWDMFCNKFAANPSAIRRKFLAAFIQQTTSLWQKEECKKHSEYKKSKSKSQVDSRTKTITLRCVTASFP